LTLAIAKTNLPSEGFPDAMAEDASERKRFAAAAEDEKHLREKFIST
jgi:hypothetical protein